MGIVWRAPTWRRFLTRGFLFVKSVSDWAFYRNRTIEEVGGGRMIGRPGYEVAPAEILVRPGPLDLRTAGVRSKALRCFSATSTPTERAARRPTAGKISCTLPTPTDRPTDPRGCQFFNRGRKMGFGRLRRHRTRTRTFNIPALNITSKKKIIIS